MAGLWVWRQQGRGSPLISPTQAIPLMLMPSLCLHLTLALVSILHVINIIVCVVYCV